MDLRTIKDMNSLLLDYSTFLMARPSFTGGMASVLDIGGTLMEYNSSLTGEEADRVAMSMDFRAVGQELLRAAEKIRREQKEAGKTAS